MPVAKKARIERTPQPYKSLWYSDGSVILKTKSHLFRVHKSILAQESAVFRDMLEVVEPPAQQRDEEGGEGRETHGGLPVVPMIDDEDEDVVNLLNVIYKRM